MRENIIKTYWQAIDGDGSVCLYHTTRPNLINGVYGNKGDYSNEVLFPIPLKPLQIAEIKVNENGTWAWEIEREEGYYMVRYENGCNYMWSYSGGVWYHNGSLTQVPDDLISKVIKISSTRIPDECII